MRPSKILRSLSSATALRQNIHNFIIARSLSSTTSNDKDIHTLQIPKIVSEIIHDRANNLLRVANDSLVQMKNPNHETLNRIAKKELSDILKASPELHEEFQYIKENRFKIIEINGWNLPEFKLENLPKNAKDLENPAFIKNIIPAQILLHMFNQGLGIELAEKGAFNSFVCPLDSRSLTQGNGELDWHRDGWQMSERYKNFEQYISLIGVLGQEGVLTQVITSGDIKKHFEEIERKDILQALSQPYIVSREDFLYVKKPVLSKDEGINFSSRAAKSFICESDFQMEALEHLVHYLENAEPTYSTELENGKMIVIDNSKAIHCRKFEDPNTKISARMAIRGFGDQSEDKAIR